MYTKVKKIQLENEIVNWLINKYPKLKNQFAKAVIIKREYSGVGFFIHFKITPKIQKLSASDFNTSPIDGPMIKSPDLEYGGQAILFIKNGFIDMLEIYSFGISFPEYIKSFQLED